VVPGCPNDKYVQFDHIVEFAKGGRTELKNLQLLCTHHHKQKTLYGFRVVRGPDGIRWVGPAERTKSAGKAGPAERAGPPAA